MNRGDDRKKNRQNEGTAYVYTDMETGKNPLKELSGIPEIAICEGTRYDTVITVDGKKIGLELVADILATEGINGQPGRILWSNVDKTSKKAVMERIKSNGVDMQCVKC